MLVGVETVASKNGDWIRCKRVSLSIEDKTEVIEMLDHGSSSTAIVAKYGIAKRTVPI